MASVPHERPRIVRSDGTLDLFALADAIHTLYDLGTDTNAQLRGLKETVTNDHKGFREDISKLQTFQAGIKEAQQFEAGVAHGRGRIFGFVDRTIVLVLAVMSLGITFFKVIYDVVIA